MFLAPCVLDRRFFFYSRQGKIKENENDKLWIKLLQNNRTRKKNTETCVKRNKAFSKWLQKRKSHGMKENWAVGGENKLQKNGRNRENRIEMNKKKKEILKYKKGRKSEGKPAKIKKRNEMKTLTRKKEGQIQNFIKPLKNDNRYLKMNSRNVETLTTKLYIQLRIIR